MIKNNTLKNQDQEILSQPGLFMLRQFLRITRHFFPNKDFMIKNTVQDPRKWGCQYTLNEMLWAGIMLFVLRADSRNVINQCRRSASFQKNYQSLFNKKCPHMDSLHKLIPRLNEEDLENLLSQYVHVLMKKKVLKPFMTKDNRYIVAIDGTGVVSFDYPHCKDCLTKTHRSGKKTWFHSVLEARLVGSNGFSLPLAVEWIANSGQPYEKQDCELKAFKRLAEKLANAFKRARFLIVADALYANEPFMTICRKKRWAFIVNFKPGNLKTV